MEMQAENPYELGYVCISTNSLRQGWQRIACRRGGSHKAGGGWATGGSPRKRRSRCCLTGNSYERTARESLVRRPARMKSFQMGPPKKIITIYFTG